MSKKNLFIVNAPIPSTISTPVKQESNACDNNSALDATTSCDNQTATSCTLTLANQIPQGEKIEICIQDGITYQDFTKGNVAPTSTKVTVDTSSQLLVTIKGKSSPTPKRIIPAYSGSHGLTTYTLTYTNPL